MLRFLFLPSLLLFFASAFAQRGETMSKTQWWLGLKTGVNATSVSVPESFTALSSDFNEGKKDYQSSFSRLGYQVALQTDFDIFGVVDISFQPGLRVLKYGYENNWLWQDSTGQAIYELTNQHNQTLTYLDLPLIFKFNFISSGQGKISIKGKSKKDIKIKTGGGLIAFVEGGVFYNKLLSADKKITQSVNNNGNETELLFQKNTNQSFINSSYGLLAGLGVGYDFQAVRVTMDVVYRKGFHNITREANRYVDDVLVNNYYDVPDNIILSNWEVSFHVLFPFKFVYGGSFKKL